MIVLSNAHTSYYPGAKNRELNLSEYPESKEVNCQIYDMLKDAYDVQIIDTSYLSIYPQSLRAKSHLANALNGDILVETHFNGVCDPSIGGTEILYYPTSKRGKLLAECIYTEMSNYLPFKLRGLVPDSGKEVLRATKCPAIILEPLFITNSKEAMFLKQPRAHKVLARMISTGIENYFRKEGICLNQP